MTVLLRETRRGREQCRMSMRLKGSFGCTKMGVSSSSHWSAMDIGCLGFSKQCDHRRLLTCSAEVDFEHIAEWGCFTRQIAAKHHKAVFDLLHVVV